MADPIHQGSASLDRAAAQRVKATNPAAGATSRVAQCTENILEGREAARVAASLSAKRSTGSNPVRPATMGSSFNGRIPGLHLGDEGSIPSESTTAPSAKA